MKYIRIGMVFCAMIAFSPVTLKAQNSINNNIEITTGDSAKKTTLEEVYGGDKDNVQVAFRTVEKRDLSSGVAVVNLPEVLKMDYTTYTLDGMSAFVGGYNGSLWGQGGALMLVDGVPRSEILSSEVEQITFLKGASAIALYGSRAAKGVILITSKKGKAGTKHIDVRANTGFFVPKSYPEYLGSAEYMTLYNEARANDGLAPSFSQETIYNHSTGENPYRYPNIDFYSDDYLKKAYNKSDITAEFAGGGERARFYTNIGYVTQSSLLNFGEAKNDRISRLNVRGNLDARLADFLTAGINVSTIFYDTRGTNSDYWGSAARVRPYRFSPLIPISMLEQTDEASRKMVLNSDHVIDGKYLLGGTQLDQTNAFADIYAAGYNTFTSRQFMFDANADADLNSILKGLSFHTQFSVDYSAQYSQSYNNTYAVYEPHWTDYSGYDQIGSLTKYGDDTKTGKQNISNSWYQQTLAFNAHFDYKTSLDNTHNIFAMLVANAYQQSISQIYHKQSNANLGLQLSYNYLHKYYADFNGALVVSAKLPDNNRIGFSPTLTLGWKISDEDFMKNASFIDLLKLSVTGGILNSDLDIADYYMYKGYYTQAEGTWYSWKDGLLVRSTDSRRGENMDMTFVKRKEFNVGLQGALFNKFLSFDLSYFMTRMDGGLVQPSTIYPSYFSTGWPNTSFYPYINYNIDERTGLDFSVNLNKRFGDVELNLGASGMIYNSEAVKRDENYADAYQNRTGRALDGLWGLQSAGLFKDEVDIANSPVSTFGEIKPGDIKYIDQNGDGVIDSKDEIFLGKAGWDSTPFNFGINFSAKWNNFTLFVLGTGIKGGYGFKNSSYYWVQGDGKYSAVVRDRWTPETAATATFPRLTSQTSDNNFRNSDFWMYKTDRFNLAKIQVTYDIPAEVFNSKYIHGMSVYASGSDLLVISGERKHLEMNVGTTPQTRFYNLGVKALF